MLKLKREKKRTVKRKKLRFILFIFAVLLVIIATTFAIHQPPHPDAYRKPDFIDKFIYPIEKNAFQRLIYLDPPLGLNGIFFLGSTNGKAGWVVGDEGIIIKTIDRGYSWMRQDCGVKNNLYSIFFSPDKKKKKGTGQFLNSRVKVTDGESGYFLKARSWIAKISYSWL